MAYSSASSINPADYGVNLESVPIVLERFSDGMAMAKDAFNKNTVLTSAISALAIELGTNSHPITTIDLIPPPTYEELDTLFNLSVPVAPDSPDFPDLPAIDMPAPSTQFSYNESNYLSGVNDSLQTKIKAGVDSGGTGLGAAVETAIWDREQERALLERADSINRLADDIAASGFPMPDGVMATMLLDQETKFVDARLTSGREIATKQAELAYQQTTKILDVGVAYENVNTGYGTSMRNRLLEAAKAGPQIAVDIFRAAVEKVNVYIAQYNALATRANAQAEVFKAQIMAYTAQADVKTKILGASVQKYEADVDGTYKANETKIQADQLLLQQLLGFLNLQLEAMKAVSNINAQIASSALTGMSASASVGGSESYGVSHSTSDSTSLQESHQYEEKMLSPQ
jgi:hypothetical protein